MSIVNFQKMQELAYEFLLKYWWEGTFPIDTVKIAKRIAEEKDDFEIYTYKELSIKLDISIAKLKNISEYGYTYLSCDGKTHIIAYNEEGYDYVYGSRDKERRRRSMQWTVGHEIGHYAAKHCFTEDTYDERGKSIKEIEADYYTKNLMMPLPLLSSINNGCNSITNPQDIMNISNLNYEPATHVYNHLYNLKPYIINNLPYKKELEKLFEFELAFYKADEQDFYGNSNSLSVKIGSTTYTKFYEDYQRCF